MIKFLAKLVCSNMAILACLAPQTGLAGLIGEPAPPLNVSAWIKGQPVEVKPGTNIFVVEIWNTTSAGSRAAITNLNNLQQRYQNKGVVVLGISDEPAGKIQAFLEQAGTNIAYEIAVDNKRHTSLTYMNPVMRRAIPYAFVVGTNGDLLWHGSPSRGLEHVVEAITSGRYDEARAQKLDLAEHQMRQYVDLARQGGDRANLAGQTLLAARTNDAALLCELAFVISTVPKLATRDFALAGQALDQAEKLAPTNPVPITLGRAIWLFESGKHDEGLAKARQALAQTQDSLEKTNIETYIQTMQKRLADGTFYHNQPAKAAGPVTPGQVPDFKVNPGNASQTGPATGKP